MAGKGCRDFLFFLGTLLAIAAHAAYTGSVPFDREAHFLASQTIPYGQYKENPEKLMEEAIKGFDVQLTEVRIGDGEDCFVELKLVRRVRPK